MSLLSNVAGFATLGFATRCYQLALQRRNIFDNFGGHVAAMGTFGALGYWLHGLEQRQMASIQRSKESLLQRRKKAAGGAKQGQEPKGDGPDEAKEDADED